MSLTELTASTIQATITMEDGGVIVVELYPDLAPQTVRNFVYLVRYGYYDGLQFHRIISGFMVQGGCPEGIGSGGPGYYIWGEFGINGFTNEVRHVRGVLSMARQPDPAYNTSGSQFFIVHGMATFLDGGYAAFGRVTSGLDVVDRIAETPSGDNGVTAPEDRPVIRSITIDDDIVLPEPEKLPR
jgi:peptidyl-prolyl cis-trans isomerase B (cyclophilin B)